MSGGAYRANLWKALQKTPADADLDADSDRVLGEPFPKH